jgi:CcdB protein
MLTQQMAAVSVQMLKRPIINANDRRDAVVAAIDLLLQGF